MIHFWELLLPFVFSVSINEQQNYYEMSATSLRWCHLVNACEVTAHLIGSLANNLALSVFGSLYSLG